MKYSDPASASDESALPARLRFRRPGSRELFTRPSWLNALLLMAGAILAPGKRTVTAALRILGREPGHRLPDLPCLPSGA